jgi:antibiotic biosynthesis monooxygenase (ABM) superfamily enzyme
MDKESLDVEHTSKDVTVVISRKIKPGYENEYDEWFRRYLMLERRFQDLWEQHAGKQPL